MSTVTETEIRSRRNLLGRRPQTVSKEIIDLYQKKDRIDLRPVYQREIRWSQNLMNNLIGTIMNNGLVPSLILYKLTNADKIGRAPILSSEVVDGQHRLFTVFKFISSEYVELPRKKKFLIYWPYKNEEGKLCPVFYNETDATREWFAKNTEFVPRYFTEEEKIYFNDFCFDIREIDFQLTIDQRRQIFMSLQNGVQVKNSDWLKNKTECGLINFMSEQNYEVKMKHLESGVLAYSYKKPDNYWVQWVCRFYFLFLVVKNLKNEKLSIDLFDNTSTRVFILGDTDYKNLCTPHDKSLNDQISIIEFNDMFECFHEFLNSEVCINIKFNPTQLFALFQYICLNSESIDKIDTCHIKVFYNNGIDPYYRKMWEKKDKQSVRAEYYLECLNSLSSIIDTIDSNIFNSKITVELKNRVWECYFGDSKTANCPCGTVIGISDNHCGHIKARARGGKTTIDNLRPICASCNLRMKTRNMNEYFTEMGYTIV